MQALLISLIMMISSGFSAVTGFGTSTISVPLLLFFFSIPQVLLFVAVMRLFGSFVKMFLFRDRFAWRLLLTIGVPAIFASMLGAKVLLAYSNYVSKQVFGGILLFYVAFLALRSSTSGLYSHFKLSEKSAVALSGGVATGFSAGAFGISGPIQSAFLSAFDLPKLTYVFTTAVLDSMIDASRLVIYLSDGIELGSVLFLAMVFSVPSIFLGVWLAKQVVGFIPQDYFRYVILLFLGIVGLHWLVLG